MDGAQLHPLTLTFASKRLEAQYWNQYLPKLRGQSAVAVGTVLVLYSVFALLDPWIEPEAVRGAQCKVEPLLLRTSHRALRTGRVRGEG